MLFLVVGLEHLLARPLDRRGANRVAELGREQAALDRQQLVPAAGAVEAERRAVRCACERVLELVAVAVDLLGRDDRLEWRLTEAGDANKRVFDLRRFRLALHFVGEILETAAAAGAEVGAGRLDAARAGLQHLDRLGLGVAALHLGDAGTDEIAGKPAADEEDEALQPRDAVAAKGERLDPELELLFFRDGRGHRTTRSVAVTHGSAGDVSKSTGAGAAAGLVRIRSTAIQED